MAPPGCPSARRLLAALIALLFALPIAILAVRYKGRGASFFERLSYGSYALPGIVVALAFVYAGINFARPLYQTMPMLIAAYMVLFVPQAVSAARSSLTNIPLELEEVGYSLGGSRLAILWYVTLPLMRPGLLAGGLLVFLTVMKELPVTLLLSPISYSPLPALIWSNINEAFFARAAAPTLLLLLLSSVPLGLGFHPRQSGIIFRWLQRNENLITCATEIRDWRLNARPISNLQSLISSLV